MSTGAGRLGSTPRLRAASTRLRRAEREALSALREASQSDTRASSAVVRGEGLSRRELTPLCSTAISRSSSSRVKARAKRPSASREYAPDISAAAPRGATESSSESRMRPISEPRTDAGSMPSRQSRSKRARAFAMSRAATASSSSSVLSAPAAPVASRTTASSTVSRPEHWSSRLSASRMPPSARRASISAAPA